MKEKEVSISGFEELRSDFFSIQLFPKEEINVEQNSAMHCFFLVNHLPDVLRCRSLLGKLIQAGCRDFTFFGEMEPQWHVLCDQADIEENPDWDNDDIALTSSEASLTDFSAALNLNLEVEDPTEPYYLFYDDPDMYHQVLVRLLM